MQVLSVECLVQGIPRHMILRKTYTKWWLCIFIQLLLKGTFQHNTEIDGFFLMKWNVRVKAYKGVVGEICLLQIMAVMEVFVFMLYIYVNTEPCVVWTCFKSKYLSIILLG